LDRTFLGRCVEPVDQVAYIDAEMDKDEFNRRARQVASGMQLEQVPEGLLYFRIPRLLNDSSTRQGIAYTLDKLGIKFVVLDSFTMGFGGLNMKESQDIIPAMFDLRAWGTVIAIVSATLTKSFVKSIGSPKRKPLRLLNILQKILL
jgi:hypothetical protein